MSKPCNRCGGSGQVFNEKQTVHWSDCAYCGGSGYTPMPAYPCARCADLETHNAALREVALEAAEYLDMLPKTFGGAREIAANLRAALEKKP